MHSEKHSIKETRILLVFEITIHNFSSTLHTDFDETSSVVDFLSADVCAFMAISCEIDLKYRQ
jgi:hypothetical protein